MRRALIARYERNGPAEWTPSGEFRQRLGVPLRARRRTQIMRTKTTTVLAVAGALLFVAAAQAQ